MDTMKTQAMPTRERLARLAEATKLWTDGRVADFNAKRALERRGCTYHVQGWTVVS